MPEVRRSLIGDLEHAVKSGSKAERLDTLRKITDLFLTTSNRLTAEQIEVFDEVIGHLIKKMEARALKELSERLAPIENAPMGVIQTLARDDQIAVAGRVLTMSSRLTNGDLIEIAKSKGQAHLLAISNRNTLQTAVTDVLVERGDLQVHRIPAASPGAQFSEDALWSLVKKAEADDTLTEKLGLRANLPLHLQRQLLAKASQIVRDKLLRAAPAAHRRDIQQIVDDMKTHVIVDSRAAPDFRQAKSIVQGLKQNGELDEVTLLQFAKDAQYACAVEVLAELCSTPSDILHRMLQGDHNESLLVPCRAAGLAWPTVKALLRTRSAHPETNEKMEELKSDYARLSTTTAQRVLRFWCVQKAAGKSGFVE